MEEVFDLFPDIIFLIKDRNSKFVFCNEAFLKFFNYRNKEEIYGATDRDILPPSIVDNVNQDDRDVIDNNRRIINRVELIVGGLGHLTWVTTNKLPLIALDDSVSGLILTIRVLSRADQLPESSQKFRKVIEHIQAHLGEKLKYQNWQDFASSLIASSENGFVLSFGFRLANSSCVRGCKSPQIC